MKKEKSLTEKEERFCQMYAVLGHPLEAACAAGYAPGRALRQSASLLANEAVQNRLDQLHGPRGREAVIGWRRLAFNPINDVVRLISAPELPSAEELEGMDLFSISSIRRTKEGTLEVELYSRMEALERLLEQEPKASALEEGSVYQAILYSAAQEAAALAGSDASED